MSLIIFSAPFEIDFTARNYIKWSLHRQEPVAPFKNATSREFRISPPAGAGGFQFAGIDKVKLASTVILHVF